ncbi:hypothetical protein [Bacillus massiliigorillae]|uniref:hypothetical protein n=1 Tax=Bacillus massiliigorillae TaxID=1243664 RepID=UPI0003A9BE9F|nr:hypothetical protein [Bacillus massiliigorillae]
MLIAIVINDDEIITPIIEGTVLRIYDSNSKYYEDFPNPALGLKEGRRGATLQFAIEQGATVYVASPQTFCELSYQKAVDEQIRFYRIEGNTSFYDFEERVEHEELQVIDTLPQEEIVAS